MLSAVWVNNIFTTFRKLTVRLQVEAKDIKTVGRAMAQVVSRRPLTAEALARALFSPCGTVTL
jgi:hypothetical protein